MGVFYETIPPSLHTWLLEQPVFYVATAPLSPTGHVNISPKGGAYFGIPSPTQFWYLDLSGSGIETIAHLHESPSNSRITILFNAFNGPPKIVRLWGQGRVLEYGTEEFEAYRKENGIKEEEVIDGTRAIVVVDIEQVGSSCGFSMPRFEFLGYRTQLNEFFEKRCEAEREGDWENGIEKYWAFKNSYSIDGLPGLQRGHKTQQTKSVKPLKKMVGRPGEIALQRSQTQSTATRTVQIPVYAISVAVIAAFLMGIITTVMFQDELGLRRFD